MRILVLLLCAVFLASCYGTFKKTPQKKLPPATRKIPPPTPTPTIPPPKKPVDAPRANVKPSSADVVTPKRQASMRLVDKGMKLMEGGDFERAAQTLTDAIKVDSTNGEAYYYLAIADKQLGQVDEAMGLLDKAEALLGADNEWLMRINELRGVQMERSSVKEPSVPIQVKF